MQALMGNTCFLGTVTKPDWRITIGFRALLMAVFLIFSFLSLFLATILSRGLSPFYSALSFLSSISTIVNPKSGRLIDRHRLFNAYKLFNQHRSWIWNFVAPNVCSIGTIDHPRISLVAGQARCVQETRLRRRTRVTVSFMGAATAPYSLLLATNPAKYTLIHYSLVTSRWWANNSVASPTKDR